MFYFLNRSPTAALRSKLGRPQQRDHFAEHSFQEPLGPVVRKAMTSVSNIVKCGACLAIKTRRAGVQPRPVAEMKSSTNP